MCFPEPIEENGFHLLEIKLKLARIRSVFKEKGISGIISVTVSASRKELSSKVDGFH